MATPAQNRKRRKDSLRPHNGAIPDTLYAAEDIIPHEDVTLDADALFVCDVIVADGDSGVIMEIGDATLGALLGINGDGDLVARFGDGDAPPITNGARVVIPAGRVPKDRKFALGFAVNVSDPGGVSEVRKLTLATGADGNETATIVLDSTTPYEVTITAGTPTENAAEIAGESFDGWTVAADGPVVTFTATAKGAKHGVFTYESDGDSDGAFWRTTIGRPSNPREVIVFIDGYIASRAVMAGTLADNIWASENDGGFIAVGEAALPAETGITEAFDGTVLSALRYYEMRVSDYARAV